MFPFTFGPELQRDGADGTASTGPALQVEAGVAGVDVSENRLILVELGLCEKQNTQQSSPMIVLYDFKHNFKTIPIVYPCMFQGSQQ